MSEHGVEEIQAAEATRQGSIAVALDVALLAEILPALVSAAPCIHVYPERPSIITLRLRGGRSIAAGPKPLCQASLAAMVSARQRRYGSEASTASLDDVWDVTDLDQCHRDMGSGGQLMQAAQPAHDVIRAQLHGVSKDTGPFSF